MIVHPTTVGSRHPVPLPGRRAGGLGRQGDRPSATRAAVEPVPFPDRDARPEAVVRAEGTSDGTSEGTDQGDHTTPAQGQ